MALSSAAADRMQMECLFRDHYSWLNKWLGRKSKAISSPEDIASEGFLRLMNLSNLSELREPRAMMTVMAKRIMYELRRRNDLWVVCEAELAARPQELCPSPEEQAIVMEALRLIDRMLETLPPKAKAAFLYAKVDGMKQDVIAEKLGVSRATVERYIAQGLKRALAIELGYL